MKEKEMVGINTCISTCEKGIYYTTCNASWEGKVHLRIGGVEI